MTIIALVAIDAPSTAYGAFVARWAQPYRADEDATTWYASVGTGLRRPIQRDRLTDNVYWCQVQVPAGTTEIQIIDTGTNDTTVHFTDPVLSGLRLRFYGQDNSRAEAVLGAGGVVTILRDGIWSRSIRRWTNAVITFAGDGNQAPNTQTLGVHAYLRWSAAFSSIVEMDVRISNASATVGTQGAGIGSDFFGHMYMRGMDITVPVGWSFVQNRPTPIPTDNGNLFPSKMSTVRRYVLYQTSDPLGLQKAQEVLFGCKTFGRAGGSVFVAAWSSYNTVPSYLAQQTILPDLPRAGSSWAAADSFATTRFDTLNGAVQTNGSSSPDGLTAPRMGWFHPLGIADPEGVGGEDIGIASGGYQVPMWMNYQRLRGDLRMDGSGLFLWNRTTGAPLRSRDFGDAYITAGALGGNYSASPAYLGRQPFPVLTQANAGYEYNNPYAKYFLGWFPPVWPPHVLETRPTLPDGSYYPASGKYVPVPPASWGLPPHTLNNGTCSYLNTLISLWYDNPTFPTYWAGPTQGYRDPEDDQHMSRFIFDRKATAWQMGDLLAIDDLHMVGEWVGLSHTEIGNVPLSSGDPINNASLPVAAATQEAAPFLATIGLGRAEAWVGEITAIHYALSSTAERNDGYPTKGIRLRAEIYYRYLRFGCMPNGASYKWDPTEAGGNGQAAEAFDPGHAVIYGSPEIPSTYQIMQLGLEMPLIHHALFCLAKQLGKLDEASTQILQAANSNTLLTDLYVDYFYDHNVRGVAKYGGVWFGTDGSGAPTLGTSMPRAFAQTGNPGVPNHRALIEYAWRLTGDDATWWNVSNHLGLPNLSSTPTERAQALWDGTAYSDLRFELGLIGYMLGQAPADITIVIPPHTDLGGTCAVGLDFVGSLDAGGGGGGFLDLSMTVSMGFDFTGSLDAGAPTTYQDLLLEIVTVGFDLTGTLDDGVPTINSQCKLPVFDIAATKFKVNILDGKVNVYDAAGVAYPITNSPDMDPPGSWFPVYDSAGIINLVGFNCTIAPLSPLDPVPIDTDTATGVPSPGERGGVRELVEVGQ